MILNESIAAHGGDVSQQLTVQPEKCIHELDGLSVRFGYQVNRERIGFGSVEIQDKLRHIIWKAFYPFSRAAKSYDRVPTHLARKGIGTLSQIHTLLALQPEGLLKHPPENYNVRYVGATPDAKIFLRSLSLTTSRFWPMQFPKYLDRLLLGAQKRGHIFDSSEKSETHKNHHFPAYTSLDECTLQPCFSMKQQSPCMEEMAAMASSAGAVKSLLPVEVPGVEMGAMEGK
jgi:hypothetical protein